MIRRNETTPASSYRALVKKQRAGAEMVVETAPFDVGPSDDGDPSRNELRPAVSMMLVSRHFDEPTIYCAANRATRARSRRHAFEHGGSWNWKKT